MARNDQYGTMVELRGLPQRNQIKHLDRQTPVCRPIEYQGLFRGLANPPRATSVAASGWEAQFAPSFRGMRPAGARPGHRGLVPLAVVVDRVVARTALRRSFG